MLQFRNGCWKFQVASFFIYFFCVFLAVHLISKNFEWLSCYSEVQLLFAAAAPNRAQKYNLILLNVCGFFSDLRF